MSKLTPVDYDKVIKALISIGYSINNQRGSHIVLRLADQQRYLSLFGCRKNEVMVVVPTHKPIGKGMVHTIIREIDLSVDKFYSLL
ncbi:MAG: type II toxin-antitoxin system HicA family toxin [Candidatus Bathyarchaeia archaeon]